MSIRHGLLALLDQGPSYGYQLRTEFEARTGATWPLNVGQVYTTLARLERDGLVVPAGEDEEGHQFYEATEAGRAELRTWFDTPVPRTNPPRDELAIKLAMAVTVPGVDVPAVVQGQRRHSIKALQDYTRLKARALAGEPARWTRRARAARRRPRLAARPRTADLPDRGRGPLARPLRDPARPARGGGAGPRRGEERRRGG